MTIKEYLKNNPGWDIYDEWELEFADPDNSKEAEENLNYVISEFMDLQTIAVVLRSYYGGTIHGIKYSSINFQDGTPGTTKENKTIEYKYKDYSTNIAIDMIDYLRDNGIIEKIEHTNTEIVPQKAIELLRSAE